MRAMRAILLCSLLLAATASAQPSADKLWQLDLVAFERSSGSGAGGFDETWNFRPIDWPEMLPLEADHLRIASDESQPLFVTEQARAQGIVIMPLAGSQLAAASSRLQRSGRFRVLSEHSLRFRQNSRTPYLRLQGGDFLRLVGRDSRSNSRSAMDFWLSSPDLEPPVNARIFHGWARLDHQIHPILELDLSLLELLPGVYPLQTDPDGRQEYFRDQVQQFRMRQERRLRPGLTAYFDHPRIGVLARLSEIQPAPQSEPPAAGAPAL